MEHIYQALNMHDKRVIESYLTLMRNSNVVSNDARIHYIVQEMRIQEALEELYYIQDWHPENIDAFERTAFRLIHLKTERRCRKRVARWLARVIEARRQQKRCKHIKEDLMAAAWHPDRFEKWLQAGVEDMMLGV
jgi:hypothetical protein